MSTRSELLLTVLVYAASLALASLGNVWLSVWGRRLSVLNSYFRSHQPALLADDGDSVRIDPFDLAALEASMAATASCSSTVSTSPVFDLGLHFLPHLHCRWLPDAFVFALLPLLVAAVFAPNTDSHDRSRNTSNDSSSQSARDSSGEYWAPVLARLCCVLQSHSVVLLMRSSTVLATVHRASPVCHALSLESWANPGFVLNNGCFDLMFSGHTAFCVLAAFFVCRRPELGWLWQTVVAALAAAGSVSNVLVGDHFTADCLVAAHIALLVGCLFRHKFKHTFDRRSADATQQQQQQQLEATGTETAKHGPQAVDTHAEHMEPYTRRSVSRPKAAVGDDGQLMDIDEQSSTQSAAEAHTGMVVEPSEERSAAGGWPEQSTAEEKELQQLINRWQLVDSHNSAATATQQLIRRHTDIR